MTGDEIARLIYMGILLLAIGGSALVATRGRIGRKMQALAIWALIFLGVMAAHGLWQDLGPRVMPRQSVFEGGRVEAPVGPDGHYHLMLEINGTPIRFVVDTGASEMVLQPSDAARAGIDPETLSFVGRAQTANGMVATAPVRLDSVVLGGIEDRGLRASVTRGEMGGSLLGMSYLSRFASIQIAGNRLVLTR